MSESKFLPYQDKNGDGLVDVCDDFVVVTPPINCPTCVPNPNAPVPNWKNRAIYEPFLNEKLCKYQITLRTPKDTTGATSDEDAESAMQANFDEYVDTAVDALLDVYNKDKSTDVVQMVTEAMEYTDYNLDYRPKSRLQLLYSVSSDLIDSLEEAEAPEADDEADPDDIVVYYKAYELSRMLFMVRKSLALYGRYLNVYNKIELKTLTKVEEGIPFDLRSYGDFGFKPRSSLMGNLLPSLEAFLNTKGYKIPYTGDMTPWSWKGNFKPKEKVGALEFTFTSEYALKKIKVYLETCPQQPLEFKNLAAYGLEKASIAPVEPDSLSPMAAEIEVIPIMAEKPTGPLAPLLKGPSWSNPTAMAYLASLADMETDLTARVPMNWVEFIIKYTYPLVEETGQDYGETIASCIGEALLEEGKQLAEDILDDSFSLADAIAYKFNENLCKKDLEEMRAEEVRLGLIDDPATPDVETIGDDAPTGTSADEASSKKITLWALAKAQAAQELESSSVTFESLCSELLFPNFTATDAGEKKLKEQLENLKLCGLLDLFAEAVQCLLGGRTLEEGLASIAEAALQAMSINNFGQLFVGLPIEKQEELDALVKEKIENGEIFKDQSANALVADEIAGNYVATKPWEVSEADTGARDSRTLVVSYESLTDTGLSDDVVMEAYIQALIEVYGEELFDLIDELNKFPGAQLITNTLAVITCPTTSLFKPSVFEFIKDVELPYCRSIEEIAFPEWNNPFAWIVEWADFKKALFDAAKEAINELIVTTLMKLMVKICEILGDAACKALDTQGALADATEFQCGQISQIADMVRGSICSEDADEDTINNTVSDMFGLLGLGATALADKENILSFTEAISCAVTRKELADAFLCDASDNFLNIVDIIIEYEYPEYRAALPGKIAIKNFFCNMGSLMPVDFRGDLRDFVNELPSNDQLPANPSLCATPEQIEDFCAARSQLLAGRASPSQIADLCQPEPFIDLPSFEPPSIISDPGCNNGIFPFEPEDSLVAAAAGIGAELESLKVDYSIDMLGNGPGERNWGFVNMILSDTKGQPLSTHYRLVTNRPNYVDYYADFKPDDIVSDPEDTSSGIAAWLAGPPALAAQKAAFPLSVAEWMRDQISEQAGSFTYSSNNEFQSDDEFTKTFSELRGGPSAAAKAAAVVATGGTIVTAPVTALGVGAAALPAFSNFDPLSLPDFGYNIVISSSLADQTVTFVEKARKKTPDFTLSFADNAKGKNSGPEKDSLSSLVDLTPDGPAYAFDLEFYLADLYINEEGNKANLPHDNARIKIIETFHPAVLGIDSDFGVIDALLMANPITGPYKVYQYMKHMHDEIKDQFSGEFSELAYEFLCVEDTLMGIDLDEYPTFSSTFQNKNSYSPQAVLLREILQQAGSSINRSDTENLYNDIMSNISSDIMTAVAGNETAYKYGAQYDSLTALDLEYGLVGDGITYYDKDENTVANGDWVLYSDARIIDNTSGEFRKIENKDMIGGLSYMQYQIEFLGREDENRVFYLDPSEYGGTYKSPAIYIAAEKNEGWLGFVDAVFPNLSPCKPQSTDFVDFEEIQEMIDEIYPQIPEDERLQYNPDCVIEVPYNKLLTRPSKAAIHGLIVAAIRMYSSTSLIKSMATITKFDPRFPQVYSSLYASYIVEVMEESLKDAQSDFAERFTPFKDEEFWYAFLEQSVQMYSDLVEQDKIQPPPLVLDALFRLNDMQVEYESDYPTKETLKEARATNDAGQFQSFKSYKSDKVLEAVKNTEEDAKLIMKELVVRELNYMGRKLMKNMKKIGVAPDVHDLNYYILENYTQGSSLTLNENMNLNGAIQQEYTNLPSSGDEHYTTGDEFVVSEVNSDTGYSKGDEYIGYYHVNIADGELVYMAGEFHTEDPHDVLVPIASEIRVPIGDVDDYALSVYATTIKPFAIEKYITIDGARYSTAAALNSIKNNDASLNISDVYPGTLELVYDSNNNVIGLTGELGVRLGLAFSMVVGGIKYEITSAEIDALDVSIGKFKGLTGDSLELLCLINYLKNNDKFRLIANYIFPLSKIVSTTAIYNELAFVPSIGEVTVATGEAWGGIFSNISGPLNSLLSSVTGQKGIDESAKPGTYATIIESDDGTPIGITTETGNESWASYKDRKKGNPAFLEFDEWDGVLLKNVKANLKRLFKKHYNFKDFDPKDLFPHLGPGQLYMNRLKAFMKPASAISLLPWWKRKRIRSNPFNDDGELCEKEE